LVTRAISGLVFITIIIGALIGGFYPSLILFSILSFIGTLEFYKLANKFSRPFVYTGALFSSLIILLFGYFIHHDNSAYWIFSIWILFIIVFIFQLLSSKSSSSIADISVTIGGALYLAIPLLSLILLAVISSDKFIDFNWKIPLSIFILTWVNDTGAYLSGRSFGKHKLFERISPNKTWEGSIGGLILSLVASVILHHFWATYSLPIWLGVSVLVSVFANIGDLMESAFKRNANVKDSGSIMPGHGGILDRFDAVLLTAPIVLAYLLTFIDL
jgi:phosphatidate cytidylyltransferase